MKYLVPDLRGFIVSLFDCAFGITSINQLEQNGRPNECTIARMIQIERGRQLKRAFIISRTETAGRRYEKSRDDGKRYCDG
jgi:hypothetical protein